MSTTATAPRAEVRPRRTRTAAGEAHRLLPRPLLVIVTAVL